MKPSIGPVVSVPAADIVHAHGVYCQLTGQNLRLAYERERWWYEFLRAGFTVEDLRRVVFYLQRQIREGRRNVGALKLRNLLQPDSFEEDLAISRVRLEAPKAPHCPPPPSPPCDPAAAAARRADFARRLGELRSNL